MVPRAVADPLVVVRGGGDLATGVVWRLTRAGMAVVVLELPAPLTVRRTVALSSAVADGRVSVEGLVGRLVASAEEASRLALDPACHEVPVMVSPGLPQISQDVVVDARLAKRNIDTTLADAALVVGLGPGFEVGVDCHAVVETLRGSRLGRVLWSGSAAPDTGTPGVVGGRSAERVVRAPTDGTVEWDVSIGERVVEGQTLGRVGDVAIAAPFAGVVRGLLRPGTAVRSGLKIGDVDPRLDVDCNEISDKALAVGGGVVEAILSGLS